jgi:chromate transport protein ChrA
MEKPIPLDYEKHRPLSGLAVTALSVGICSGPAAMAIAYLALRDTGYGAPLFGGVLAVLCAVIASAFCAFVHSRLSAPNSPRGKTLAVVGIIAAITWASVLIGFMFYLNGQLE